MHASIVRTTGFHNVGSPGLSVEATHSADVIEPLRTVRRHSDEHDPVVPQAIFGRGGGPPLPVEAADPTGRDPPLVFAGELSGAESERVVGFHCDG